MVYLGTVGIHKLSCSCVFLQLLQEYTRAREIATHEGGNTCFHMGGNFQGCSHAVNCYFKAPPPPDFYTPPVIGPSTCKQTNRGTQRQFPSKYVENTFQAIQSTFRSLEMHSKQHYKSLTVWSSQGNLSLFEITRASVLFFLKCQVQFNVLPKREFF